MGMSGRPYQVLRASSAGAFHGLSTSDMTPRIRVRPASAEAWAAAKAATSSHHWPKSVSMMSRVVAGGEAETAAGAATLTANRVKAAASRRVGRIERLLFGRSYDDPLKYIDLVD